LRFFNTDEELINWVIETFGGKVAIANSNSSYGHKRCLRVEWIGQKALPILEGIKIYLHGKKARVAEYAIEQLSCVDTERRGAISEAMHILNT